MSEWGEAPLGELLEHLFDHRGRTPKKLGSDWVPAGVQVISAKLMTKDYLDLEREQRFVDESTYQKWMPVPLSEGDVLLTSEAPLGRVGVVPSIPRLCLGQRLYALRSNESLLDSRFLLYWLRSPVGQQALVRRASGTTVKGIRQSELVQVEVPLPPIREQQLVGSLLQALDDLISNNRRRIELLEEMAQAIYREWFVHFRFPGHEDATFVDSPLGPIPEGWEVAALEQLAHLTMGQSPKSEFYNEAGDGSPFHQGVKDFGLHLPTHRTYCTVEGRAALDGDVLISVRAPVGRLNIAPSDLIIGRGLAAARARSGHQSLLFYALKLSVFAVEDSMGSGTIFKAITKKDLANLWLLWPTSEMADRACAIFTPMVDQVLSLTMSNVELALIRDLLLPKLVTGEIDVSDLDLDALVRAAS